ncbi:HD domain-containing protein [Candidatus Bipolaricaulota bacterium]|nr:HD domain-containing protein [Candidatus Bipolaricaulota bacterium]
MKIPSFIHKSEEHLDRVAKDNTDVRLLARHDSLEVMKQKIAEDSTFYLDSAEDWQGFEFIYLIHGRMEYTTREEPVELVPGDYIARKEVQEESWFTTKTDVTLLYASSQPSFHLLKEEIEDFLELAQDVETTEEMKGHSKRLVRMSYEIGKRLGLSTDRLGDLRYAAFFHDIGKAEVPDELLEKKSKLTEEEWEIMEKHTVWGREMLVKADHLQKAAEIVEQTHERLDGEGYPKGLSGEDILLEARIISVVDAWDAMRTDRPYRDALTKPEAIEELKENKGTQFDPKVVDAFLTMLRNKGKVRQQLGGRESYKDEALHIRKIEKLHDLSQEILLAEEPEEIMAKALEATINTTPFQRGLISLFDKPVDLENPGTIRVERFDHIGLSEEKINQLNETDFEELEVNTGKFDERYQLGNSYYVPHAERDEKFQNGPALESKLRSEETLDWHPDDSLYIPLFRENNIIGQISVDDPEDGLVPDPKDLQPIENFALLASLALEKLTLAEGNSNQ